MQGSADFNSVKFIISLSFYIFFKFIYWLSNTYYKIKQYQFILNETEIKVFLSVNSEKYSKYADGLWDGYFILCKYANANCTLL